MAQVTWSPSANRDLHSIHDVIALGSTFYARRFIERVMERIQFLGEHPMIEHVFKEFNDHLIRELGFGQYRIIHKITTSELPIVRIFHGKQELRKRDLG